MKKDLSVLSYNSAREQIENGDIIFVHGIRSIVDRAIMFFTRSTYVHVGIAFWIMTDDVSPKRLMIVEAQGGTKRRIINLSYYRQYGFDVVNPPVHWNDVQSKALEQIGVERYSMVTAFYVGLREFLLKRFNIKLPKSNFPGEICSEFVARLENQEQIEISPEMLFENLSKEGYTIKIKVGKE